MSWFGTKVIFICCCVTLCSFITPQYCHASYVVYPKEHKPQGRHLAPQRPSAVLQVHLEQLPRKTKCQPVYFLQPWCPCSRRYLGADEVSRSNRPSLVIPYLTIPYQTILPYNTSCPSLPQSIYPTQPNGQGPTMK